jgi:hypothetical protein
MENTDKCRYCKQPEWAHPLPHPRPHVFVSRDEISEFAGRAFSTIFVLAVILAISHFLIVGKDHTFFHYIAATLLLLGCGAICAAIIWIVAGWQEDREKAAVLPEEIPRGR